MRTLPAQDTSPTKSIDWKADYDATLKLAKKAKRPIMVAFILKGESANESICADHFQNAAIIEMSRRFDCLLAFANFVSSDTGSSTESSDALLAELKGRVSLEQLERIEKNARGDLMESSQVSTPQFVFLKPDGETVLLRHVWTLTEEVLLRKMQMAYHFFDSTWPLPEGVKQENEIEKAEIGTLIEQSDANNMNTRREAIRKLATKDHPEVIEFLIKQTGKDLQQQRRLEAIRAMGQAGQAKFLPTLHRLLVRESSFQIRSNVADAIKAVGLVESVPHLAKAVKKEKKDNVRSLLLRALSACAGGSGPELKKALSKCLKSSSNIDRFTALYIMATIKHDPSLDSAVLKCAKNRSGQVRTAAYFVIGSMKLEKAASILKKRFSSEKQVTRNACGWALSKLGKDIEGTFESPSGDRQPDRDQRGAGENSA